MEKQDIYVRLLMDRTVEETVAFIFIRADIDSIQNKYKSVCQKRKEAANNRWTGKSNHNTSEDFKECKSIGSTPEHYKEDTDTGIDIDTGIDTDTGTDTKNKTTTSTTGVRVRRNAGNKSEYNLRRSATPCPAKRSMSVGACRRWQVFQSNPRGAVDVDIGKTEDAPS